MGWLEGNGCQQVFASRAGAGRGIAQRAVALRAHKILMPPLPFALCPLPVARYPLSFVCEPVFSAAVDTCRGPRSRCPLLVARAAAVPAWCGVAFAPLTTRSRSRSRSLASPSHAPVRPLRFYVLRSNPAQPSIAPSHQPPACHRCTTTITTPCRPSLPICPSQPNPDARQRHSLALARLSSSSSPDPVASQDIPCHCERIELAFAFAAHPSHLTPAGDCACPSRLPRPLLALPCRASRWPRWPV